MAAAAVAEKPRRVRKPKAVVAEAEPVQAVDGFGPVPEPEEFAGVIGEPTPEHDGSMEPDAETCDAEEAFRQEEEAGVTEAGLAEAVEQAVVTRDREAEREAQALGEFHATVGRSALAEAITTVARGVSGRSTQPVQNNILLRSEADRLTLVATDLEFIQLQATIPAGNTGRGALTLPVRVLQALAAQLPDADVELTGEVAEKASLLSGGARGKIAAGRTRARIRGLSAEDFECLPPMPEKAVTFELPQAELKRALAAARVACSSDETRPTLTGMEWRVTRSGVTFCATDTHRLVLREVRCEVNNPPPPQRERSEEAVDYGWVSGHGSYIVSARAIAELERLLSSDAEEGATVKIVLSANQGSFEVGTATVGTRLIEGQFPDYQKVIPDGSDSTVTANTKELAEAIRRVLIVGSDDAYRVCFEAQADVLMVSAESPQIGDMSEEVEAELAGEREALSFALNGSYCLDALAGITSERVRLGCCGPLNPVVWEPVGGAESACYVQMPMQK